MLINSSSLNTLFTGFKASFAAGFVQPTTHMETVAMRVNSDTREEEYGWLGLFPKIREWLGDRVVHSLTLHNHTIKNRKFELTIEVERDDIADDRVGVLAPLFRELGRTSRTHPDELLFTLLAMGFTELAYDGQFFFDTDHPVIGEDGLETSVANMTAGAETPWYLIDASRALLPLVFQEREGYDFQRIDKESDEHVFMKDKYLYGVRARVNAGFGLWQLAYASKVELTADNYGIAKQAMLELKGDHGHKLGIRPTHLIVPPSLESKAKQIVVNGQRVIEPSAGQFVSIDNEWKDDTQLIVTEWL